MKSAGRMYIPSVTLEKKDLKVLIDLLLKCIDRENQEKLETTLTFQGKKFKEEYSLLELPEFREFQDDLEVISLLLKSEDNFQISILMSSQEINPFSPSFSQVSVESNNSTFVAGALDEIRRFFERRRNLNSLFHSYGIPVAILLSVLLTYVVYFDLESFGLLEIKEQGMLGTVVFFVSYPLKSFLRWMFPYVLFKGENRLRDYLKFVLGAIFVGLLSRGAYTLITSGIPGFGNL